MVAEDFGYCMPGTVDDLHYAQRTSVPSDTIPPSPWDTPNGKAKLPAEGKIGNGIVDNCIAKATETAPHCTSSAQPDRGIWCSVPQAPADPILKAQHHLRRDTSGLAVDLSVGAYRDERGQPTELRCITQASHRLSQRPFSHGYLPLSGHPSLRSQSVSLLFGTSIAAQSVAVVQTVSGSGAIRLALELCRRHLDVRTALVSDPSWPNHAAMAAACGLHVRRYAYYDRARRVVQSRMMLHDLDAAPRGSVVVLHACAHNPTGMDMTEGEWMDVGDVVEKRGLVPLFDMAYQGLASGDLDMDAWAVRMFVGRGIPVMVASSMSKSMGLYNSRVGTLHVALKGYAKGVVEKVLSQLVWLARAANSSPPAYGARLATEVLGDEGLRKMWMEELGEMAGRMRGMRRRLREELEEADGGDWAFVQKGCGMFVVVGMTERQVREIRERWHMYLGPEGRLNVCGLTEECVRRVARAIVAVLGTTGGRE